MESLLHEIRKDVFIQARGVEFSERMFCLVDWLCGMSEAARKSGLLALEEAAAEVPPEIGLSEEIPWLVALVVDATAPDDVIDVAIARYWMGNFQGEDALLYYMAVLAVLMIQAGEEAGSIRRQLLRYLPQEAIEQYEEYRSCKLAPVFAAQREKLFQDASVLEEQWTLRTLLEEKIRQAEDGTVQRVLRDADSAHCITAFKGLSPEARQKLLSNLSEEMVDMLAEDWERLEPVTCHNLTGALRSMLRIFEYVEKKPAEK